MKSSCMYVTQSAGLWRLLQWAVDALYIHVDAFTSSQSKLKRVFDKIAKIQHWDVIIILQLYFSLDDFLLGVKNTIITHGIFTIPFKPESQIFRPGNNTIERSVCRASRC